MRRSLVLALLALCAATPDARALASLDPEKTYRLVQSDLGGLETIGDAFGSALAAGDLDADGFADLAVGAPVDAQSGSVAIFAGGPSGGLAPVRFLFESNASRPGGPPTIAAGDVFGNALAIGNFDGDDRLELVVGAPGNASDAGAIFVFEGAAVGTIAAPGAWFDSGHLGCGAPAADERFGAALAAGDLNGDGYDDLVIGAPGASADAGRICVVPGGFGGLADGTGAAYFQDTNGYTPSSVEAGDRFGAALAIGHFLDADFERDAFADLAIGAPGEAPGADPASGAVAVWFGKDAVAIGDFFSGGVAYDISDAALAMATDDEFGAALAVESRPVAGDRLFVGAPGFYGGAGTGRLAEFSPAVNALPLGSAIQGLGDGCCANGSEPPQNGDRFADEIVMADVDGDGYEDFVVGVPGNDAGAGMVVLYPNDSLYDDDVLPTRYSLANLVATNGEDHGPGRLGRALAAGDFDGDGRDEVAIGAPLETVDLVTGVGAVWVAPEPESPALAVVAAALALLAARRRRRSALVIGVALLTLEGVARAEVSFDRDRTVTLTQPDAGAANEALDSFGAALVAGDLDADGDDDLVVGAPLEDLDAEDQGAIFVYPGGLDPSGFFADARFFFASDAQRAGVPAIPGDFDSFGAAFAIGNFDADPARELVVGAPGWNGSEGAVFVFQGGGPDAITTPGALYQASHFGCGAAAASDLFGSALAAGDVNGDGYDDLAIGVPGASGAAGKVCLVPGSFSGLVDGTGFAYFQNTNDYTPSLVEAGDRFGASLAFGHFDDGDFADLVIGTPGEAPSADPAGGTTAVWFGKDAASIDDFFASGVAFSQANVIPAQTIQAGDEFGAALAVIPDPVGNDRLVIGAPGESSGTGVGIAIAYYPDPVLQPSFGWVYDQTTYAAEPEDAAPGDRFGSSFAVVDLDGNGHNELLIGTPGEDGGDGRIALWSDMALVGFALSQSIDVHDLLLQNGLPHEDIGFGTAMAAGDFDGDGRFEVAIGAPRETTFGVAAGAVYVVPEPDAAMLVAALALASLSAAPRRTRTASRSR